MKIIVGGNHECTRVMFYNSIKNGDISFFNNCIRNNNSIKMKLQRLFFTYAKKSHIINDNHYKRFVRYDTLGELFDISSLKRNEPVVFIFTEMNCLFADIDNIQYLRNRFPASKFIGIFMNTIGDVNFNNQIRQKFVIEHKDVYDILYAINERDLHYGIDLLPGGGCPYDGVELETDEKYSSDILWLGANKGRYEYLKEIGERLKNSGYKIKFILLDKDMPLQNETINIIRQPLDYYEYLKYVYNTKCLLDIDRNGAPTLRTREAIAYGKLYLTNNNGINSYAPFEGTDQVIFFDKADDLENFNLAKYGTKLVDPDSISSKVFLKNVLNELSL